MSNFPHYKKAKTADLNPYANNANQHSDEQIKQIAESIKVFGFMNPIIVDAKGMILAGHGRLLAAQQLGLVNVPVLEAKHLTESQKQAYILADNQLAHNAYWDTGLLKIELTALMDADFDLAILGFDEDFVAELITDSLPAPIEDDEEDAPISHDITCPNCGATFAKDRGQ